MLADTVGPWSQNDLSSTYDCRCTCILLCFVLYISTCRDKCLCAYSTLITIKQLLGSTEDVSSPFSCNVRMDWLRK